MPSPVNTPIKIVVLISGNGSNLQAIIDAINNGLPAKICAVISDQANAYGLKRAVKANIPSLLLSPRDFATRDEYERALQEKVAQLQPDLIVLAGFMRILSADTIQRWGVGRLINIHPSLLPKYRGLNTHQQVIEAKETHHGASVHFVTAELDAGPIIAQASLEVSPHDTAESLANRVLELEHKLYPSVIDCFAHNKLHFKDGRVYLEGQELPPQGITIKF